MKQRIHIQRINVTANCYYSREVQGADNQPHINTTKLCSISAQDHVNNNEQPNAQNATSVNDFHSISYYSSYDSRADERVLIHATLPFPPVSQQHPASTQHNVYPRAVWMIQYELHAAGMPVYHTEVEIAVQERT